MQMLKYNYNLTDGESLTLVIPERERRCTRSSRQGQALFFCAEGMV